MGVAETPQLHHLAAADRTNEVIILPPVPNTY